MPALYDPPMSKAFRTFFLNSVFIVAIAMNTSAFADEGMWLFSAPPLKQIKQKYQFEPTPQWLPGTAERAVPANFTTA
jgi:hypothetical protein